MVSNGRRYLTTSTASIKNSNSSASLISGNNYAVSKDSALTAAQEYEFRGKLFSHAGLYSIRSAVCISLMPAHKLTRFNISARILHNEPMLLSFNK